MVTRNLECPRCGCKEERTAIGMDEPSHICGHCRFEQLNIEMKVWPSFGGGFILRGPGFHCVDYPKSAEQLKKDYGLDKHDSNDPNSDYNQPGYAEEMVSSLPNTEKPK